VKPERFAQLKKIVLQAADLSVEERKAYLDEACGDDSELRREAEEILADGDGSSAILPKASRLTDSFVEPDVEATPLPNKIGRYTIKRVIATGGMGVVYEALQEKPRRTVALKVMKSGITSTRALRRFEYESQLLARLQHPGIAQVYEAGTHDDGSGAIPYFAMEYVPNARPVTRYAEEKKLGTRERMQLFAQVCDAVHHGHQKGIIHRDLKPGNILVNPQGQVKIIDFGVARSTDSDLALTTLQTDVGQLIGTLQYMSPEQCEADPHDIDTRSDVYALGVVQYELLCGRLPYDVRKKAIHEVTRVIREEQPTRPSTISKHLRGDVETIALKALEKERERRYQSAVELAQDIRRYLAGEAIVGRPPSIVYQLRIFARRHKALFGALTAIFVVLAVGLAVSSGMYLRAERALAESEERRAEAEAVTKFLSETMAGVNPFYGQGSEVTILEMLDRAEEKIDEAFSDQPLVEATLRATMGNTYWALGQYPTAEEHLDIALAIRKQSFGEEHPDTVKSKIYLAELYWHQGRYDEAESLHVRTLEISRRVLGEDHPDTLNSMNLLGLIYYDEGRYGEAEPLLVRGLELSRRVLGEEHPDTLNFMNNLGLMYNEQGRYDEAEPLFMQAIALKQRVFGEEHPNTMVSVNNLGLLFRNQGRYDEAEPLLLRTLDVERRLLSEEHDYTLHTMNDLAGVYRDQGRYDEAEQLFVRTLELRRRVLGEDNSDTQISMKDLAGLYRNQGRYGEAESLFTSAIALARESLPEGQWRMGDFLYEQGLCLTDMDRYSEAEAALIEANEIFVAALGVEHNRTTRTIKALVELYDAWGKLGKANQWLAKLPKPVPESGSDLSSDSQPVDSASE